MTGPVVQLFVHPRPGWAARRRTAALRRAFVAGGAGVILTPSLSGQLEIDALTTHACAVGGDGTLRHVVAALRRCGRPVSVSAYPAGTVNLLARERGYPRGPRAFARRVLENGAQAAHHIAQVGDTPVLTCASAGPDSFAVAAVSPALKAMIGRAAYVWAFCTLLVRWRRVALTVAVNGERIACEAIYIAKGRYFAGPWAFAPAARATDPLLHVVTLAQATRRRFLRFAWAVMRGGAVEGLAGVRCLRCTALSISGEGGVPLQADGDIVACLPCTITLLPEPAAFA